jgi:hypothetical protein
MPSRLNNLFRKLTWDDFRGPVPRGTSFAAATSSTFRLSAPHFARGKDESGKDGWRLTDDLVVTVVFDNQKSWRIDMSQWPDQLQKFLLDHEQGHYDITALVARDLFIKLMSLKTHVYPSEADGRKDIKGWENTYGDRKDSVQEAYDAETGHSQANVFTPSTNLFTPPPQKGAPQREWEKLIASAFTKPREPLVLAPDGVPYKVELTTLVQDFLKTKGSNLGSSAGGRLPI